MEICKILNNEKDDNILWKCLNTLTRISVQMNKSKAIERLDLNDEIVLGIFNNDKLYMNKSSVYIYKTICSIYLLHNSPEVTDLLYSKVINVFNSCDLNTLVISLSQN